MTKDIKKVALVTGASNGIGQGIARYLLMAGYRVVLIARQIDKLEKTYAAFSADFSEDLVDYLALDITQHENLTAKMTALLAKEKRVDVLVNSAGYVKRGTSELGYDEFIKMLNTNLAALFAMVRLVAPYMKQQRSGRIINISSNSGIVARSQLGGYCASKFGVMGFNESLHKELMAYGIYVTALCPSWVNTSMTQDIKSVPREALIQVEDIVQTVDYLLHLSPSVVIKEIVIRCRTKELKALE